MGGEREEDGEREREEDEERDRNPRMQSRHASPFRVPGVPGGKSSALK